MFKFIKKKENKDKGFTLVELVIVVAILAILVGILAPQYTKYVEKSRKTADLHNLDNVVNAIKVAAADQDYQLGSKTKPTTEYRIIIGDIHYNSETVNEIELQRLDGDGDYDEIVKAMKDFAGLDFQTTRESFSGIDYFHDQSVKIKSMKWGISWETGTWESHDHPFWATDSGIGARVVLDNSTGSISVTYTDNVTNYLDHGTVD